MPSLPHVPNSVNQTDREILLHESRTASQRSRLETAVLENITGALRHRQIGIEQARAWLAEEALSSRVEPRLKQ
jgi:hypothetical protein